MNARSTLRIGLPLLLTAAVLSVLLGFLWQNRAYIAGSYSVRPAYFAVVAGLVLATLGVRGLANRLHFAPLGVRASTADWFRLVTVTSLLPASLLVVSLTNTRYVAVSPGFCTPSVVRNSSPPLAGTFPTTVALPLSYAAPGVMRTS